MVNGEAPVHGRPPSGTGPGNFLRRALSTPPCPLPVPPNAGPQGSLRGGGDGRGGCSEGAERGGGQPQGEIAGDSTRKSLQGGVPEQQSLGNPLKKRCSGKYLIILGPLHNSTRGCFVGLRGTHFWDVNFGFALNIKGGVLKEHGDGSIWRSGPKWQENCWEFFYG